MLPSNETLWLMVTVACSVLPFILLLEKGVRLLVFKRVVTVVPHRLFDVVLLGVVPNAWYIYGADHGDVALWHWIALSLLLLVWSWCIVTMVTHGFGVTCNLMPSRRDDV